MNLVANLETRRKSPRRKIDTKVGAEVGSGAPPLLAKFSFQFELQNPILWLSLTWVALCASLVHKYNELIGIFFAFLGSFLLAFLLSNAPLDSKSLTPTSRRRHARTKDCVGLVACAVSFMFLGLGEKGPGVFQALSTSTGYLAFNLWFSSMYCRPIPPPIFSILEDVLTLTLFLVRLSLQRDKVESHRAWIVLWVAYKASSFIVSLASSKSSACDSQCSVVTTTTAAVPSMDAPLPRAPPVPCVTLCKDTWIVHGVEYDLADFVKLHPGGKEAVELARGRDCTALFESYHPFTNKHRLVLGKYQIDPKQKPDLKSMDDPFYATLKQRVAATLAKQGIDPEKQRVAPPLRVAYYALIATCLLASGYGHIKGSFVSSFLFGVFGWLIGALGHDAGHFAASRSPLMNNIGVWGMSLLCNPIMWQHQHTYAHHSHTNEFEHDPDLHHFHLLLRVHRRVQQQDYYKNQRSWLYVMFAYTFVVFGTCFWIPLDVVRTGFLYGIVEYTDRHRPLRAFGMVAHMAAYVVVIMVVPFFTASSWYVALASVVVHISTSGFLFGIFSQVNHLSEACLEADVLSRKTTNRSAMLQNSWAAAQVETANNFAPHSHFWHILSNGLNLQIEHHLFPSVNHSHLYRIAPVVEQTCKEFGVNYKCFRSWSEVFRATLTWLDQLAPPQTTTTTGPAEVKRGQSTSLR